MPISENGDSQPSHELHPSAYLLLPHDEMKDEDRIELAHLAEQKGALPSADAFLAIVAFAVIRIFMRERKSRNGHSAPEPYSLSLEQALASMVRAGGEAGLAEFFRQYRQTAMADLLLSDQVEFCRRVAAGFRDVGLPPPDFAAPGTGVR